MDNLYNYDYQFRLIVVGDSTVGKVNETDFFLDKLIDLCMFSRHYYAAFVMVFSLKIP